MTSCASSCLDLPLATWLVCTWLKNLAKKVEEIKKDLEAKKKPPSSWGLLQHCVLDSPILLLLRGRLHFLIPKLLLSSPVSAIFFFLDAVCCLREKWGYKLRTTLYLTSSLTSSLVFLLASWKVLRLDYGARLANTTFN
jgi:hypothetical protein